MHFAIGTCPHCKAHKMTFDLYAVGNYYSEDFQSLRAGFFQCRNCGKPYSAGLAHNPISGLDIDLNDVQIGDSNIESLGWYIYESWPSQHESGLPGDVPKRIRDVFAQAETNFRVEGHEESAAIMYRKAMEIALTDLGIPGRTLYDRIESLISARRLGPEVAEWAHEVRLIGNDAAHETAPPDKADVADLRGLTETLLRLLYVIPALVRRRREKAEEIRNQSN